MKSLVKRAQRGDDQAFVELIEENKQAMYKIAVGILKNDFDAADAIQESILTCYEKLRELKKAQYFKTWLLRILINNCNQMLREQKKVVGIEDYYGAEDIKGKKAEEKIAAPPGAASGMTSAGPRTLKIPAFCRACNPELSGSIPTADRSSS